MRDASSPAAHTTAVPRPQRPDAPIWLYVALALVFTALAILAFRRLSRATCAPRIALLLADTERAVETGAIGKPRLQHQRRREGEDQHGIEQPQRQRIEGEHVGGTPTVAGSCSAEA